MEIEGGIAFVFEGETEQVFYEALLYYFNGENQLYTLSNSIDESVNERVYHAKLEKYTTVIRMKTVGTVTQMHNVAAWFNNSCKKQYKENLKWTVFLCYDTDSYKKDITKFYEGDWQRLRKKLRGKNIEIIDFAAISMIEDLFLLDSEGICNFLGLKNQQIPRIGNGKTTLKKFFRDAGKIYHEGEKSSDFILSLNFSKIIADSTLDFVSIGQRCFPIN